jgi:hypothetical protein
MMPKKYTAGWYLPTRYSTVPIEEGTVTTIATYMKVLTCYTFRYQVKLASLPQPSVSDPDPGFGIWIRI